jgi:predicted glycoside hydrolase/deacetylase ChbG (UPF0249 family)
MLELARTYECGIRLPFALESDDLAGLPPEVIGPIREYGPQLLAEFDPPRPDAFFAGFYDATATRAELLRIIDSLPEGTYEIMCHPGHVDQHLLDITSYAAQRQRELEILTDPEVREGIQSRGIQLITFEDL